MNKPLRVSSARWSCFYGRRRLRGTVLGYAALAILATVSVSACSTGSSTPTTPPSLSAGASSQATPTVSASDQPSASTPSSTPSTTTPSSSPQPQSPQPDSAQPHSTQPQSPQP